jgi:hypothetical protein
MGESAAHILREYAAASGIENLTPKELAEGLIVARVNALGWT